MTLGRNGRGSLPQGAKAADNADVSETEGETADQVTPEGAPAGTVGRLWRFGKPMAVALGSGAVAAFFAAGLGSRTVMKIIALADPSTDGAQTDATATVGEFTTETFGLVIFGTFLGLLAGPVYLGLRRWLPGATKWHGLTFGVLTMFTAGVQVFDESNADFQIFEPILLAIGLFMALHLVNGPILAYLVDRFHPQPAYKESRRVTLGVRAAMGLAVVAGVVVMTATAINMVEDEGTCLSAAGEGNGCAVRAPE